MKQLSVLLMAGLAWIAMFNGAEAAPTRIPAVVAVSSSLHLTSIRHVHLKLNIRANRIGNR